MWVTCQVPLGSLALALEPLRTLPPPVRLSRREVHLLRESDHCALLVDEINPTHELSADAASRMLSDRLAPLRVAVHYEGTATEGCLSVPEWLLEDAVGICPGLAGFAVPRRTMLHREPATHFPRLHAGRPREDERFLQQSLYPWMGQHDG
jgi:hypothetical protein